MYADDLALVAESPQELQAMFNIVPLIPASHHLGILRSVFNSTISRTAECSVVGWSAFFALNAIGSIFGCLHPITSNRLYSALSLPVMLYGSEL